jgi:hypothetical protein
MQKRMPSVLCKFNELVHGMVDAITRARLNGIESQYGIKMEELL